MEMENKLLKLSEQVAFERSKGFIKNWPDAIKNEAIYLCEVFGLGKVAKVSKIGAPSLYLWKTNLEKKKSQSNTNSYNKTIKVTRIIANENSFKEQIIIASIVKNEMELKIFCKDTATKIVESFLK